ncbi:M23 family metallopeptidase [Allobacillus halotolerans]|uniref:M23 family metallopeptidase n=1 Tax=Allobacillus halotolerans TaxID=570278 RepID=A0ABS6GRW6_9BACI|nr:M23 family metallopeptidase [Allobacillus halotolerans]MBU6081856.1 M23 family metallopeptidase [Allobacillus halotolerans]
MSDKERKFLRQSKWKRLTRQRWFYPTLYIGLVAVVLAGVMIYQFNAADDTAEENANDYSWNVEQNELIESSEEDAAEEDQLDALIFYNNQYYQSKGVDITSSDGESFEVIASLTGKVTSVKEDDLLGKVVEMEHDGERATMYASLSEVYVSEGDELTQGDPLGLSGENVYSDEEVSKVHFRLMEEGQPVNPGFK